MSPEIKNKFSSYPEPAQSHLLFLRQLIFDLAKEESLGKIDESLKWGEPSYLVKKGSAIRMDWKARSPETLSLYFNCQSRLIEIFKEIYPENFNFVGKREIVFQLQELEKKGFPLTELKDCLSMAMRYQDIKNSF